MKNAGLGSSRRGGPVAGLHFARTGFLDSQATQLKLFDRPTIFFDSRDAEASTANSPGNKASGS